MLSSNVNASKVVKVMKVLPPYPRKAVKDWSINDISSVYKWFCYIAKVQYHMVLACDQANAMCIAYFPSIYILNSLLGKICTMCIQYLLKTFNYIVLHIKNDILLQQAKILIYGVSGFRYRYSSCYGLSNRIRLTTTPCRSV